MKPHHRKRRRPTKYVLRVEQLESRMVLSATHAVIAADPLDTELVQKAIVAGDPSGSPQDSPTLRVDPNVSSSPFSGVGSLKLNLGGSQYICTGTLISPTHVLTAGHCIDLDNNGSPDANSVSFVLNHTSTPLEIPASGWLSHPDYSGFANPSVLDDVAIITLSNPAPAGAKIYPISTDPFINVETVTMVGYGTSGDGANGYYVSPSYTVKRSGQNHADVYMSDDEGTGAREGFQFDFDGDNSRRTNVFGSWRDPFNRTLGNDIETMIGGGDSGGPSFLDDGNGNLTVFGVNTFTGGGGRAAAPYFGSIGGGIVVSAYQNWISSIIGGANLSPTANAGPNQNVVTGTLVTLDGSNSSDPDGDPLSYSWTLTTLPAGSSATLSNSNSQKPTFTADIDGTYIATLQVDDGNGNIASDTVSIVAAPAGASLHVGDIDGSTSETGKRRKWRASVTVTIHDNNDIPVAGATVTGQWGSDANGTSSGTTDSQGNVSFTSGDINGGSTATFTVTNVSGSLVYDQSANHDPDGSSDGTTIELSRGGTAVLARMNDSFPESQRSVVAVSDDGDNHDSKTTRDDETSADRDLLVEDAIEVIATFDSPQSVVATQQGNATKTTTHSDELLRAVDEFLTILSAQNR